MEKNKILRVTKIQRITKINSVRLIKTAGTKDIAEVLGELSFVKTQLRKQPIEKLDTHSKEQIEFLLNDCKNRIIRLGEAIPQVFKSMLDEIKLNFDSKNSEIALAIINTFLARLRLALLHKH